MARGAGEGFLSGGEPCYSPPLRIPVDGTRQRSDDGAGRNRPPPAAFSIGPNSDWRLSRVQVVVRDNNIDQALKALKKKLQREGVFREMKLRRHYEKPSERRAREAAEAVRRARKVERKRLEREGF